MRVKQLGFQFNTRSPAKSIVIDSMRVARESSSPMSRHVRHRHRGDVRDVQLAAAGDVAHLPRLHDRKRHPVPCRPDAGHPSILAQVFRALALFLLVAAWVYYGAWADGLMTPLAIRRFGRSDQSALRSVQRVVCVRPPISRAGPKIDKAFRIGFAMRKALSIGGQPADTRAEFLRPARRVACPGSCGF